MSADKTSDPRPKKAPVKKAPATKAAATKTLESGEKIDLKKASTPPIDAKGVKVTPIITVPEASSEDLQERLEALETRLDKQLDKQHNEQRNIIIGVLIAAVLIIVTVAADVIIFNASFNGSLDQLKQQTSDDYRSLRDAYDQQLLHRDQQLLEIIKANSGPSSLPSASQ